MTESLQQQVSTTASVLWGKFAMRSTHAMPTTILAEPVLLFPTHYLGNLVLGLPWAIELLQQRPGARLVVDERFQPLIDRLPIDAHQLLYYPRSALSSDQALRQRLQSYLGFLRSLRELREHTLVDLEGERFTGTLSLLSGSRRRLGPIVKRGRLFYTETLELDYQRHRFNAFGQLLKEFLPDMTPGNRLPFAADPAADARLEGLLGELDSRPLVLIHAGASVAYKYWPAEHFAELARQLIDAGNHVCWIGAGADDQQRIDSIRQLPGGKPGTDLCDRLDLSMLLSLMQRASCFVGSDSGPMHLAAGAGLPLSALFGPSREAIWAPLGDSSRCLRGRKPCADDCDAEHCRFNYRCLQSLSPDRVFQSLPAAVSGLAEKDCP